MHAEPGTRIIPLTGWRYVTGWTWSWGAGLPIVLSALLYLWGVYRLRRNGVHWPLYRTWAYCVMGMGSLAVALLSFLGTYDTVLFWTHMVQHMILSMISPVFIAQGAPVTLALRTLPHRPRKWLLAFLHSWIARIALFPPLSAFFMIAMPFMLYMTPLYDYTLRHNWAHDSLHAWMVVVGCCFFVPILAVDPVPTRMPYPIRLLLLILTMPFHAFIGTTIMGATQLIGESWYVGFGRAWPPSPLRDQYWAGSILWSTGDLTMFTTMSALAVQWWRDSQREGRRVDRALDREDRRRTRLQAGNETATGIASPDAGARDAGAAAAMSEEDLVRAQEDAWSKAYGIPIESDPAPGSDYGEVTGPGAGATDARTTDGQTPH